MAAIPSNSKMLDTIDKLWKFMHTNGKMNLLSHISSIEQEIFKNIQESKRQGKISNYFGKHIE